MDRNRKVIPGLKERWNVVRRSLDAVRRDTVFFLFDPWEERMEPAAAQQRPRRMGSLLVLMFGMQVATGILLSLYYQPSPDRAYESVKYMLTEVHFGTLIRSLHHWTAVALILVSLFHLLRVFFIGAFKYPRELNWLLGILLLALLIGFSFTGHLLPWDARAFWSGVRGTAFLERLPLFGHFLMTISRGGEEVGAATLIRFYSLHILILPWFFFGLLAAHLLLVRRHGLSTREPERD